MRGGGNTPPPTNPTRGGLWGAASLQWGVRGCLRVTPSSRVRAEQEALRGHWGVTGSDSALSSRSSAGAESNAEGVAWGCALSPEWLAAAGPEPSLRRSYDNPIAIEGVWAGKKPRVTVSARFSPSSASMPAHWAPSGDRSSSPAPPWIYRPREGAELSSVFGTAHLVWTLDAKLWKPADNVNYEEDCEVRTVGRGKDCCLVQLIHSGSTSLLVRYV